MNKAEQIFVIEEYDTLQVSGLLPEDISYLRKFCPETKKPPFNIYKDFNNNIHFENTSYSGVLQLKNVRLQLSTKVETSLFYLLSFLQDENSFIYDPECQIKLEEGTVFFDVIGRLFLNELKKIQERGFYKKYVRRTENKSFLKGKLILKGQIENNIRQRLKFCCSFEDLTYDNLENRIILSAANILLHLIRYNQELKAELASFIYQLSQEVSLLKIHPEECERINFCKLNEHYESIIKFSKTILQHNYIRSIEKGSAVGFNFIVNMNKVYEDFLTAMIGSVINENVEFNNYEIEAQKRFDDLIKERRIVTKPDIILKERSTRKYPLLIDAKYKKEESNSDYYQVIAYSLAIPSVKACCLMYPAQNKKETIESLTLDTTRFGGQREIKLYVIRIDLSCDKNIEYNDYINVIKERVRKHLQKCLI